MKKKELLKLLEKYKDNDNVDFTTIGDDTDLTQRINMWYIIKTKHPTLPLYIYNYTDKTQYEKKRNEHTITHRWLIKDEKWNIIARSFNKIFNYEELSKTKLTKMFHISDMWWYYWSNITIKEKLDWSMLIVFYYEWQWITATRWSFTSEQAIEWMKILKENNYFDYMSVDDTYIFEVIYPENRIIVNYWDERRCVLLWVFDKDNKRIGLSDYDREVFDIPKTYWICDIFNIDKTKEWESAWQEWFVCWVDDVLFKIKFEDYIRLHKDKFNYSREWIFEQIKVWVRDFSSYPDEYHSEIKKMIEYYDLEYQLIQNACYNEYQILWNNIDQYSNFPYSSVIFAYIKFKDVSKYINSFINLPPSLWTTQPE